ncbi:MAG: portal protein [Gemmatimonadaceae bacterium]
MTVPTIPTGLESQEEDREGERPGAPEESDAPTARGPLLDLPEDQATKEAIRLWNQHKWYHKVKAGESRQNSLWRNGVRFTKLVKEADTDLVKIVVPSGLDALPPTPNKVEESIKNAIAILMADPPRPECEPSSDSAQARDAAQFATRFLLAVATESGLNTDAVMYGMLDIGATYSSGFAEVGYDRTAGGYVPLSIQARPSATTTETREVGEMPDGSLDTAPFVKRYVMPDQTLSESPKGAQMTWQAGLVIDLLNSNQLKFLPRTCGGIAGAKGVVIGRFVTLGDLKAKYETVAAMTPEQLHELAAWTVDDYKRLLPEGYKYDKPGKSEKEDAPDDDTLICTLTVYYKSHLAYPKGAACCFAGGKYRLHAIELAFEGEDGTAETMDIPVAQMAWEIDADGLDPNGTSPVRRLGPMDEMRATQYAAALEYLYRFSRPRPFLPMGSLVTPEDLADPDKPILFNPQGKPEWQPLPDFPQMGMALIDRIDAEMANTIGIQGPALGQIAGSIRSAEQQKTLIEQSNVALTALRNNAQDAYERLHRIILQQARAWFDVPQLMTYRGEDGAYQVQEFTRADFGDTKMVRVQRNTFTMLAPTNKNELITLEMQNGGLTPEEATRLRRDNVSSLIGIQDNPHVLKIRRQLQAWRKGPPAQLPPPQPQVDPNTGQPVVDPMTGQPAMQDPTYLAGQQVFARTEVDDEQLVAVLRHQELARAMAELEFYAWPPGWKQALMETYMHARQASGVQTIAEQQQAMAQQQAAEQQAAQQAQDGEQAEKAKDREAQQGEAEQDRKFQMDKEAMKSEAAQQREAMRMAMQSQGVA